MRKTAIKLIDIISILSNSHYIKIGVDGTYYGTFKKEAIQYSYMNYYVRKIWVYDSTDSDKRTYLCLDLVSKEEDLSDD